MDLYREIPVKMLDLNYQSSTSSRNGGVYDLLFEFDNSNSKGYHYRVELFMNRVSNSYNEALVKSKILNEELNIPVDEFLNKLNLVFVSPDALAISDGGVEEFKTIRPILKLLGAKLWVSV